MIVDFMINQSGETVLINTAHIVSVTTRKGTKPGQKNEITVNMIDGKSWTTYDDQYEDGEFGPEALKFLAKIAPEEFNEKFLNMATRRSHRGAKQVKAIVAHVEPEEDWEDQ